MGKIYACSKKIHSKATPRRRKQSVIYQVILSLCRLLWTCQGSSDFFGMWRVLMLLSVQTCGESASQLAVAKQFHWFLPAEGPLKPYGSLSRAAESAGMWWSHEKPTKALRSRMRKHCNDHITCSTPSQRSSIHVSTINKQAFCVWVSLGTQPVKISVLNYLHPKAKPVKGGWCDLLRCYE